MRPTVREEAVKAMGSPFRSSLRDAENRIPPPQRSPAAEAKVEKELGSRAVTGIVQRERREASVRRAAVGVRATAVVLCLLAFSLMAADKRRGWALDSYDRYAEYRYIVAVNVIGFVYSGYQLYREVGRTARNIIHRPMGCYFDFAMDQMLAYLLISASSSATARTDEWVGYWGSDPFPHMASGSVAMSFMAFVAFALSSLISAASLFTSPTCS